ncbi:MAG: hypothetical protein QOE73_384, partial [Verrucomicrobiota bacterium]
GPHDFAVRCNISRPHAVDRSQAFRRPALRSRRAQNAAASTASHPASVTIAIRPSVERDGESSRIDLGQMGIEIFFGKSEIRLDSPANKRPDGQISRLCRSIRDAKINASRGQARCTITNFRPLLPRHRAEVSLQTDCALTFLKPKICFIRICGDRCQNNGSQCSPQKPNNKLSKRSSILRWEQKLMIDCFSVLFAATWTMILSTSLCKMRTRQRLSALGIAGMSLLSSRAS